MKASIDIGTNTVLLLIAKVQDGRLSVVREEERTPRLGKGVDRDRNISQAASNRVITVLKEYQDIIGKSYPAVETIRVTTTSAVRDAQNRSEFLGKIKEETGLDVEIVSGFEEAQLTCRGALSVLRENEKKTRNVVVDIGGGSTEIAVGENEEILDRYSFDMGCVRFTERYLTDDPPNPKQIIRCKNVIFEMLEEHLFGFKKNANLIGVAGTVTSLAYIDLELKEYDNTVLNGCTISKESVARYISRFNQITSEELAEEYPVVLRNRADIFRAGLLILEGIMTKYAFYQLRVSTGGIRHGAILSTN